MKFLTVDEVVAAASTITGNPTREERMIYSMWVWMAEKQIQSYELTTRTDELTVIDFTARKPLDYVDVIDLALIDGQGNDIIYKFRGRNPRIHPATSVNPTRIINVYEDDDCFHLESLTPSSGSPIQCVNIKYRAMPIDSEGNLMIPENHLQAIMRYIKYMDAERKDGAENKLLRLEREWKLQARKVRGNDKMPNSLEAREIFKKWMTHIPNNLDLRYNTY